VNIWYDNTSRSRLNNQQTGAIIIVMQRLHSDDLVAHVQEHEAWEVLSFAAIAEQDEVYRFATPYGLRRVDRKAGDILQPSLLSPATLKIQRRSMTEYNFVAQYQQDPQPLAGIIVKREWLRFYGPAEKPDRFDQIIQSWDTANKDTELSNYSVCTTWGRKDQHLYLLDVFRRKMEFPTLKKNVLALAEGHRADIVLVEDKASGTSLIQELRAQNFSKIQETPAVDGDKIMRLRAQTAKIEGGFVLFPREASWLDAYILELVTFPNSKNDDQVDSTVYALAWSTLHSAVPGILQFYKDEVARMKSRGNLTVRIWVPPPSTHWDVAGKSLLIPANRIVEVSEDDAVIMVQNGCKMVD
jgi:predicted phage terminase large subunit-like protein